MESHSPSRARRSARAWTARERLASGVGLDRTLLEVNMDPTDIDVLESRGGSGDAGAPSSSPGGTRARLCSRSARADAGAARTAHRVKAPVARAAATASRWSTAGARAAPTSAPRAPASGPARHAPHLGQSLPRRLAPQRGPSTRRRPEPAPEPERTPASSLLAPPPPPGRRRSVRRTNALWSSTPSSARSRHGQALPKRPRRSVGAPRAAGGPIPPRPSWTRKSSAHRTSGGIRQRSVSGLKSVGARWRRQRLWGFSS